MSGSYIRLVDQQAPHGASWDFGQAIVGARFVEWSLRDFGIRVPADNRISRAAQILAGATQIPWHAMPFEHRLDLTQAARTVLEQYLIVRAIHAPSVEFKERLRWLLKGSVRPKRRDQTQPYDVQFELFAGAALIHAGIEGIRLDEPDWRIVAGDREIGIAAKRVSSRKNYPKLVHKAISQVRNQSFPGVVVLNFDALIGNDAPRAAADRVTAMTKEARQLVASFKAEDVVFGLFGFATSFELHSSLAGSVLSSELFTHGELIEPDLSGASKIRAWFATLGRNIMHSVTRAMAEMPDRAA